MKKGFTLIELLVVVSIIGILATVLVVNLSTSQVKARNARIQNDVEQLSSAAEIILLGSAAFTGSSIGLKTDDLSLPIKSGNTAPRISVGVNSFREEGSTVNLIASPPSNPASNVATDKYHYYFMKTNATGTAYVIYAMAADTFKGTDSPTLATGDKFYFCKTGKACSIKILTDTDAATPSY
ncbi:MAG: type II secretion system protein [Patescibacteria group bacterium]|jgi:prepilin-type N-terminal cleavage/methylation domain-containing protein